MSFSYKFRTLRSGNLYLSGAQLEMSAHEDEIIGVVEADAVEVNNEISMRNSPDFIDDEINDLEKPGTNK